MKSKCIDLRRFTAMKRLLISGVVVAVALAAGIAIAIASTGGGGGGGGGSSAAAPAPGGGTTVSAKQISGAGMVLVDSKGEALYANDQEKSGMVLCDGACLSFWTPLTVSGTPKGGDSLNGTLGVVRRPNGDQQVAFNGRPLYTFYLDSPGKVGGDGFDDAFGGQKFTWHVVHGNGSTSQSSSGQGNGGGFPGY
jgi:predicted lipoprotein with Yx(FWY)xxD motif